MPAWLDRLRDIFGSRQAPAAGSPQRPASPPARGLTAEQWQEIYTPGRDASLGAETVTKFRQDMQAMREAREERAMYQDPAYYAHVREQGRQERVAEGLPRDLREEANLTFMEQRMQRLNELTRPSQERLREEDAFQRHVDRTEGITHDDERTRTRDARNER